MPTPEAIGRLTKTPVAGQPCSECASIARALEAKHGQQPVQPAHVVAYVHPDDYVGLNMGPDTPGEIALCWECVSNLLPWVEVTE